MEYLCTLTVSTINCPNLLPDQKCKGNTSCNFCAKIQEEKAEVPVKKEYVRKERWYEKYYRKS